MSTLFDIATVTVSEPVDGRRRRRKSSAHAVAAEQRGVTITSGPVVDDRVHPLVMAAAKRIQRPGERIVIVDARTVRLIPS